MLSLPHPWPRSAALRKGAPPHAPPRVEEAQPASQTLSPTLKIVFAPSSNLAALRPRLSRASGPDVARGGGSTSTAESGGRGATRVPSRLPRGRREEGSPSDAAG